MYIDPGQGQTTPWGQNFDVNKKALSLSSKSLGLSAPEEACSRNVRASGTLKLRYEGIFKIITTGSISLLVACPRGYQ